MFLHFTVAYKDLHVTTTLECEAVEMLFLNHTISVIFFFYSDSGPAFSFQDTDNVLKQLSSPVVFCWDLTPTIL